MIDYTVAFVTVSSVDEAKRIALMLIGSGLAPCVNIVPACVSMYQWKGEIHTDEETLMIIKSETGRFDELCETIEKIHSYDVPEIIALPLLRVSKGYLGYLEGFFG